jgi:hypothetical protein
MKNQCFACFKQADVKDLKRCARCRGAVYCVRDAVICLRRALTSPEHGLPAQTLVRAQGGV